MATLIEQNLKPKPQPQFPDYSSNYQKMIAAQTACNAQGGSFSSAGCYVPPPPPAPVYVAPVAPVVQLSGNFYKDFIYEHESGNNPAAVNPYSGACGLGQALPCSKLGCTLGDYACQDAWFTNYADQHYGGWAGAYEFWVGHSWW